ncbi:hypothetical protein FACS1894205_6650 [Alphaproteobacteria bacterium]|nr:hypothetical protein FACS1894205_6650 [Alphaproteobacteria bacterium]
MKKKRVTDIYDQANRMNFVRRGTFHNLCISLWKLSPEEPHYREKHEESIFLTR